MLVRIFTHKCGLLQTMDILMWTFLFLDGAAGGNRESTVDCDFDEYFAKLML